MTEKFQPLNSEKIQLESLINFMAALGYDQVEEPKRGLVAFSQPAFACVGKARVSVNSAIRMHNEMAEENFAKLKFEPYVEFKEFVANEANVDEIVSIFAGSCKIVETVKATFSRKNGLMFQSQNVKFMTRKDFHQYKAALGM